MPSNRKSRGSRHRSHKEHQKQKLDRSSEYAAVHVEEAGLGPHLVSELPQWMAEDEQDQQPLPAWVEGPSVLSVDMASTVSRGIKRKGHPQEAAANDLSSAGFGTLSKRWKGAAVSVFETEGGSSTHSSLDRWDGGDSRADEAFSLMTLLDSGRGESYQLHLKNSTAEANNFEAVGSSSGVELVKGEGEERNPKAKCRTSAGSSSRPITVIDMPVVSQVDSALGDTNIRIKNKVSRMKDSLQVPHDEAIELNPEVQLDFSKEQLSETHASDSGKVGVKKSSSTRKHDKNTIHSQSCGDQMVFNMERKKGNGDMEASQKLRRSEEHQKSSKYEMQNRKSTCKSAVGDDSSEALDEHATKSGKSFTAFELDLRSDNRNPELEKELENRIRRRREESRDRDRWRDDEKDRELKRHHRQAEKFKESNRRKDEKNKSERFMDKKLSSDRVNDENDSSTGESRDEKDKGRIKYVKQTHDKQKNARQMNDKEYDKRHVDEKKREEKQRHDRNREEGSIDERHNDRQKEGWIKGKDKNDKQSEDKDERWRHNKLMGSKHRCEKEKEERQKDDRNGDEWSKHGKNKEGLRNERVKMEHEGRDLDERLIETAQCILGQREEDLKSKEKEKDEKQRPRVSADEKERIHKYIKGEDRRIDKYKDINSVKIAKMPGSREKVFKHLDNMNNDKAGSCRSAKVDIEIEKDGDDKSRNYRMKDDTCQVSKDVWNSKGEINEHEKHLVGSKTPVKTVLDGRAILDTELRRNSKQVSEKYKGKEDILLEELIINNKNIYDKPSNEKQGSESQKGDMKNDGKLKHEEPQLECSADKNDRFSVGKKQTERKNTDDMLGLHSVACHDDLCHGSEYKQKLQSKQDFEHDMKETRILKKCNDEKDQRGTIDLRQQAHEEQKSFTVPGCAIDPAQEYPHRHNSRPVLDAAQRSPSQSFADENICSSHDRSVHRVKSETTIVSGSSNITWRQREKIQHSFEHTDRVKQQFAVEDKKNQEPNLLCCDSDNNKQRSLSPGKCHEPLPLPTTTLGQGEASRGSSRDQLVHEESGSEIQLLSQAGKPSKVRTVDDTCWEWSERMQHVHQTNRSISSAIMRPQVVTFGNRPSGPPGLLPPPPPLRPGIDNPAILSYEEGQGNRENGRYDRNSVGHYKRADIGPVTGSNDTWRGMGIGNWSAQNQGSCYSNMFSPFPHQVAVHPSGYIAMGQQYPLPHLFGRNGGPRPSPDMVFGSGRFHVADAGSGFHSHGPVMGWRRPGDLDDTHHPLQGHLDTWKAPRMYADDRQRYLQPEWERETCVLSAGGGEQGLEASQVYDIETNPIFNNPTIQRQALYETGFRNTATILGAEEQETKKLERPSIDLSEESNKNISSSTINVVSLPYNDKLSKRDLARKTKLLLNLDISLQLAGSDLYKQYLKLLPVSEAERREYASRQEHFSDSLEDDFDLEPDVEAEALISILQPCSQVLQSSQGFIFQAPLALNNKTTRKNDSATVVSDAFSCLSDDVFVHMMQVDEEAPSITEQGGSLSFVNDLDNISSVKVPSIMIDYAVSQPFTESNLVQHEHVILSVNSAKQENCNAGEIGSENIIGNSCGSFNGTEPKHVCHDDDMLANSSKLHFEGLIEVNHVIQNLIETTLQLCEIRERSSLLGFSFQGSEENPLLHCNLNLEEASQEASAAQRSPVTAVEHRSESIKKHSSWNTAEISFYSSSQEHVSVEHDEEMIDPSDEAAMEVADCLEGICNGEVTESIPEDSCLCSWPSGNTAIKFDETTVVRSSLEERCTNNYPYTLCSTENAVDLATDQVNNIVGRHSTSIDAQLSQFPDSVEIRFSATAREEDQLEAEMVVEAATELLVGEREGYENLIPQQSPKLCENTH